MRQFGQWTVVETKAQGGILRCRCSCGFERDILKGNLTSGRTRSCGHGRRTGSRSQVQRLWEWMHARCYNSDDPVYKYYGGRGITVAAVWHTSKPYIDWVMDHGWKKGSGLQIDRIDNDGPYSPENCRVTTRIANMNNRSNSVRYKAFGKNLTLAEWSREPRCGGIRYGTLWARVHQQGWSIKEALTISPDGQQAKVKK